jgi:hypothetical protein
MSNPVAFPGSNHPARRRPACQPGTDVSRTAITAPAVICFGSIWYELHVTRGHTLIICVVVDRINESTVDVWITPLWDSLVNAGGLIGGTSSGLKTETAYSIETLVFTYQTTRCRHPGEKNLNFHPMKPQNLRTYQVAHSLSIGVYKSHVLTAVWNIQGAPGVKVNISEFNSRADIESKTSYTYGSNPQRFRSYGFL